jgi:PEP-CTERM motif
MLKNSLLSSSVLAACLILIAGPAQALLIGPIAGSWDGTEPAQTGRIFRTSTPSDGNAIPPKPFRGASFTDRTFLYELFQFYNNGPADVVTIDVTVSSDDTHFTAFRGTTYDPVFANNGPNYLGDVGIGSQQPFSFLAPANMPFFVVASTNFSAQEALGETFSFTAEGNFISRSPAGVVPEPATLALFGIGLAGLGFMRRRRATA